VCVIVSFVVPRACMCNDSFRNALSSTIIQSEDDEEDGPSKSTRFAEGTNPNDGSRDGKIPKAGLARDHSLGREYLKPDEPINLDGFSWQDPFKSSNDERISSQGSLPPVGGYFPDGRVGSHGSMGGPPPPTGPYTHTRSGEERHYHYTQSGRYESWGSLPPQPMPGYPYQWGRESSEREHSLGQNPLPHASIGHPAPPYSTFDPRGTSGQWGPPPPNGPYPYPHMSGPPPPYHYAGGPPPGAGPYRYPSYGSMGGPPPPQGAYDGVYPPGREYSGGPGMYPPGREYSGGPPPGMPPPLHHHRPPQSNASTPSSGPSSPQFEVDPAVASTWSGKNPEEILTTWSGSSGEEGDRFHGTPPPDRSNKLSPKSGNTSSAVPKPDIVKRATSHQNETPETRPDLQGPSVKKAALNRDNSTTANRLKEKYLPDYHKKEHFDQEIFQLSSNLEQSTLIGDEATDIVKPKSLLEENRTSTIDQIAMDLMAKPDAWSASNRLSTLDALELDLEEDALIPLDDDYGVLDDLKKVTVSRPPAVTFDDRLTTTDIMDLVSEPIPDDDMGLVSGKR
jgi:hypothetical protein